MAAVLSQTFADLDVTALHETYRAARPYPHIVLDDVLDPEMFARAVAAFPEVDGPHWTNYLHVNERKFGNTHLETWPAPLQDVAGELMSPAFVSFLERLTGIEGLLPDPTFDGGGLHRSHRGGFLNVHADYRTHHTHHDWERRVNVLVYLNDEWDPSWGGQLELWSADMKTCAETVAPTGNRMVVFSTTDTSFHGHPDPLACPDGVARKSMALYYFTPGRALRSRPTDYRARPGDGAKRLAIYLDKKALRVYDVVKRKLGFSDATVSRWLAKLPGRGARRPPHQPE